jgi:uncharacterized protein (DUF2237 family)
MQPQLRLARLSAAFTLALCAIAPVIAEAEESKTICAPNKPEGAACRGPKTADLPKAAVQAAAKSVLGAPLASCGTAPLTGWFRDGRCDTGPTDSGVHVVCAAVTQEFLTFSRGRGNDLVTPHAASGFPGLRPGDRWCLCAERWREAREAGVAPPVVPEATHARALEFVPLQSLEAHRLPARVQ